MFLKSVYSSEKGHEIISTLSALLDITLADDSDRSASVDLLFQSIGKSVELPEKEFLRALHLFIGLLNVGEEAAVKPRFVEIVDLLVKTEGKPVALKLQVLGLLWNLIEDDEQLSFVVFQKCLKFSISVRKIGVLCPFLGCFDDVFGAFTATQQLELLKLVFTDLYAHQESSCIAYGIKYLKLAASSQSEDSKTIAFKTALTLIKTPGVYSFAEFLSLGFKSSAEFPMQLLNTLFEGSLVKYHAFAAKNVSDFAKNGVDEKQCLEKMRVMAFIMFCSKHIDQVVKYADMVTLLEIAESELEFYALDASRTGLVQVKLNQIAKTISIRKSALFNTPAEEWDFYATKLASWKSYASGMAATLDQASLIAQDQTTDFLIGK